MNRVIPKVKIIDLWTGEYSCKYKSRHGYSLGCRCTDCSYAEKIHSANERKVLLEVYKEIKKNSCCDDCGWNLKPQILHFHHIVIEPSNRHPLMGRSIISFIRELRKGVFLCPICHNLRHYDEENDFVNAQKIFKNSLYVEGSKGTRISPKKLSES